MARIRSIPKAVKEIRDKDPNTYISERVLRRWVKQGLVPTIPDGGTFALIDMDRLEAFMEGRANADR